MENETTRQDQPTASQKASRRGLTRDAVVASICGFVVVLMVGASYAAVPFYNWFCRATGFNGTTQVATLAPSGAPLTRKMTVRFDANVAPGLPWKFEPEQNEIAAASMPASSSARMTPQTATQLPLPPERTSPIRFRRSVGIGRDRKGGKILV